MANNHRSPFGSELRAKWYFQVEKMGKSVVEVCKLYLISRKTYYKWRDRDRGNIIVKTKKIHLDTKIKDNIKLFIINEKKRINYGPYKMRLLIKRRFNIDISTTAIYKFYKKQELIFRPQKRLAWYTPIKDRIIPYSPGEIVQMDSKYIYQGNIRKYQRTFIDIYTGMQFATITNTMSAEDTINAYLEAEEYFPFKLYGIQSDNGTENRGDFHRYLTIKRIVHYFIPKSSPSWDGVVERAH